MNMLPCVLRTIIQFGTGGSLMAFCWQRPKVPYVVCRCSTATPSVLWWQDVIPPCVMKLLTHWGCLKHICVNKQTIIGSDNSLSPGRHQAILWTNGGLLWIGPLGTSVNEISCIFIRENAFEYVVCKMALILSQLSASICAMFKLRILWASIYYGSWIYKMRVNEWYAGNELMMNRKCAIDKEVKHNWVWILVCVCMCALSCFVNVVYWLECLPLPRGHVMHQCFMSLSVK